MKRILFTGLMLLIVATTTFAQDFLLGEETKGLKVKISDDTDITMRIRLQPRVDFGDIIKSKDGKSYSSDMDMYLRRIRLEFEGKLAKDLKYSLIIEGDKNGKAGKTSASASNEVKIQYAYLDYKFVDAFNIRFGKTKLPYSRVSLTSSSKQLVIERPVSTEAAKKLFDDYYQMSLLLHGGIAEGIFNYNLAIADGWENGNTLYSKGKYRSTDSADTKVFNGGPLYVARIELSPPGWTEKGKSDSHLGQGQHLTLAANYAAQKGIEYSADNTVANGYKEDRTLTGFDVSGHWNGITAQFEYNIWNQKYTDPNKKEEKPEGWYGQAGYFVSGLNIEPIARYEVYDQDSNSSDKKEKTTTIGVNWYAKGHSFKVGLNWAHTEYEKSASGWLANDDTKDTYQVQAQLYF